MTWLQPLGLLALLTLPVIVLIHCLRARRRTTPVSSLLLWADAEESPRSNRRWRPPRLTLLLLLQLFVATLVGLALGDPARPHERARHLAIVLDGSAAMQAVDVQTDLGTRSRFEAARTEAQRQLATLGRDDAATLVLARRTVAGPATTLVRASARSAALAALADDRRTQAGDSPSDLGPAVAVAEAALRSAPARSNELLVLTGVSRDLAATGAGLSTANVLLASAPARVTVKAFGSGGANSGLAAFDVRRPPGQASARGYARIANYGDRPITTTLALAADRIPLERLPLSLAPRGEREVTFGVPPGAVAVTARLEPGEPDALAGDDRAAAAVDGARRAVLLVAATDSPLRHALEVLPGVSLRVLTPDQYASQRDEGPLRGTDDEAMSGYSLAGVGAEEQERAGTTSSSPHRRISLSPHRRIVSSLRRGRRLRWLAAEPAAGRAGARRRPADRLGVAAGRRDDRPRPGRSTRPREPAAPGCRPRRRKLRPGSAGGASGLGGGFRRGHGWAARLRRPSAFGVAGGRHRATARRGRRLRSGQLESAEAAGLPNPPRERARLARAFRRGNGARAPVARRE